MVFRFTLDQPLQLLYPSLGTERFTHTIHWPPFNNQFLCTSTVPISDRVPAIRDVLPALL